MAFYAKKICAIAIFGILLGLLVRYVNGCTTFCGGALTAYALWCVVNWFHIRGGFIGMLLAIPAALVAGVIVFL